MDFQVVPAQEAENAGFAKFNGGDHLCVDLPNGHSTISVRLSDGRKVTFAFCPYEPNGIPRCVDILDNGGKVLSEKNHHAHAVCGRNGLTGMPVFRTDYDDENPVTLVTLVLR